MLNAEGLMLKGRVSLNQLTLRGGDCLVVCGPNGGGKSSLLRLLSGVERPDTGHVSWQGVDLHGLSPLQRAAKIAWLPQRFQLLEPWPVENLVASFRYRFFESESVARKKAVELLERYRLAHLVGRLSSEISGGELQRVMIASLVAQEAELLIFDEPANHLDPLHQIESYRSLGRLWRSGKSVVIVSHDVRLAQLLGPAERVRVLGLADGTRQFDCSLADSGLHQALSDIYQTRFVPRGQTGSLAADLTPFIESEEDKS